MEASKKPREAYEMTGEASEKLGEASLGRPPHSSSPLIKLLWMSVTMSKTRHY
jgi:hypothetical protein